MGRKKHAKQAAKSLGTVVGKVTVHISFTDVLIVPKENPKRNQLFSRVFSAVRYVFFEANHTESLFFSFV